MAISGQFIQSHLVWKEGMSEWQSAGTIEELKEVFAGGMPPIPPVE